MKLTQRQLFLLKEIVSKAEMNELTGKYTIYPKDYLFYNLNKRTFLMLERLCNKYNICIEKLPDRISIVETEYLFKRYNELKSILDSCSDSDEKVVMENEMIEINANAIPLTLDYGLSEKKEIKQKITKKSLQTYVCGV